MQTYSKEKRPEFSERCDFYLKNPHLSDKPQELAPFLIFHN